jgi:hypothetical protein
MALFLAWMKIIIPDGQTTWLVTERVDPLILVVAEKLPGLSETLGKETSCGDGSLPVRQIRLEGIMLLSCRASKNRGGSLSPQ